MCSLGTASLCSHLQGRYTSLPAELGEHSRRYCSLSLARCFLAGLTTGSSISDAEVVAAASAPSFMQPAVRKGASVQKCVQFKKNQAHLLLSHSSYLFNPQVFWPHFSVFFCVY